MLNRWMAIALSTSIGLGLSSCTLIIDRQVSTASPSPSPNPVAQASSTPNASPASPSAIPPEPVPSSPQAQIPSEPLPVANADGNYPRTSHRRWVVVDPDPAGLNCRWSEELPEDWYSPAAQYPRMNVKEWPVVRQYPTGSELLANITPAGFATMYDENQNPWLKVSLNDQDEICLVRAHVAYVKPVE